MRFDNNELALFLERDNNNIDNIIESEIIQSMPTDVRKIYYEALFKTEKEDPIVTDAKMKYANKKISTIAELEQRLEEIVSDDPRSVIRAIKIFKLFQFGLMLLSGMASFQLVNYYFPNTSIVKDPTDPNRQMTMNGRPVVYLNGLFTWENFFRSILAILGGYVIRGVINKACNTDFLVKFGAKILRWIWDCRDSDANKIRMMNEVIKTTNRTVRYSKNNIEKEVLIKYMNQVIAKRDEIASRFNLMNKGAPPLETRAQPNNNTNTPPQQNNTTQLQNNGNVNNNTQNQQPTTNTNQLQQNNNTPSQPQQNPENVVKNNEETKQQQKQS